MEIIVLAVVLMVAMLISYLVVEITDKVLPEKSVEYYIHYTNPNIRFVELFRTDEMIYLLQTRDNIRIDLSLEMFDRDFKRDI